MEDPILAPIVKMMPSSYTQFVIRWLSQNLNFGENCITYISGSKNYRSPSWFVLTNKRLIFTSNELVRTIDWSKCIVEFDLKNIKDGRYHKKMFHTLGEIQVITVGGVTVLDNVHPEPGKTFTSSLLKVLNEKNQNGTVLGRKNNVEKKDGNNTTNKRFQELNNLYHGGEISLEEYCAKRNQIIDEL